MKRRWLYWHCQWSHTRLFGHAIALLQITGRTGRHHIVPGRLTPPRPGDNVVECQILGWETPVAVLAGKPVPQENVKPRKSRSPRTRNILLKRDDTRQLHLETWAADHPIVVRDDIDPVQEHGLHRFLPRPQRQRKIAERTEVRIQDEGWTVIGWRGQTRNSVIAPGRGRTPTSRPSVGCLVYRPGCVRNIRYSAGHKCHSSVTPLHAAARGRPQGIG